MHPTSENRFDAGQARGARGRWTEAGAVKQSRAANALSAEAVQDERKHEAAARAHEEAAAAHRELATRHGAIGNAHAARRFGAQADREEQLAWGHWAAVKKPKGPGIKRVSEARLRAARRAAETRSEREEAVTVNLPAHLLPLWRRTRRQFKGTPQQREDAFLQYVHDHQREAGRALQEDADSTLDEMIREYEARANPRRPTEIQTIIFDRAHAERWTKRSAGAWLRLHGYHTRIETTATSYRARQAPPESFEPGSFRTIHLADGLSSVVGHPKRGARTMARKRKTNPRELVRADQVRVGDSVAKRDGDYIRVTGIAHDGDRVKLSLEDASPFELPGDAELQICRNPEAPAAVVAVAVVPEAENPKKRRKNVKKNPRSVGAKRSTARTPKKKNPNPPSYRASHWGLGAEKEASMSIPDPRKNGGRIVGLGELVGVIYLTRKGGDSEPTEYIHKFKKRRPVLGYGKKDGRLYVAGGSYRVTSRGIEG